MSAQQDIVWIPAVPLPLMGWRTDRCSCGERFRGRNRRERYEVHYRRDHERHFDTNPDTLIGVTREEAKRIYDLVNADLSDCRPERQRSS